MKTILYYSLLTLFGGAGSLPAQSAATVPEGYLTIHIPAGSIAAPSITTFSLPLREAVPADFTGRSSGRMTAITSTTIANSAAAWNPGALSQPATPYFLRITSGNAAGRTFQINPNLPNTDTIVTVLNQGTDLTTLGIAAGESGDTYEIFPGDTLASLLGSNTLGGTSTADADVVRIHNGAMWSDYYYNTAAGEWREGAVPVNRDNVVLRPDGGITFYRRGPSSLTLTLLGRVPHTAMRVIVRNSGATYVGNLFPVDQTIFAAAYNALPGWVTAGPVGTADKVRIWNGATYDSYNFNQTASQWRVGSVPVNRNSALIPAGTPVILERPGSATGVTTLLRLLPYSL